MAVALMAWAVVLGGCLQYQRDELASAEAIAKLPTERLVASYGNARRLGRKDDTILNELAEREGWNEETKATLRKGTVYPGYTRTHLIIARGHPNRVTRSTTPLVGYTESWIYRRGRFDFKTFYLVDDVVTSWYSSY
ncbi:MAG: hypothetical protein AAF108_02955 [Planctomycetota bacterium]